MMSAQLREWFRNIARNTLKTLSCFTCTLAQTLSGSRLQIEKACCVHYLMRELMLYGAQVLIICSGRRQGAKLAEVMAYHRQYFMAWATYFFDSSLVWNDAKRVKLAWNHVSSSDQN